MKLRREAVPPPSGKFREALRKRDPDAALRAADHAFSRMHHDLSPREINHDRTTCHVIAQTLVSSAAGLDAARRQAASTIFVDNAEEALGVLCSRFGTTLDLVFETSKAGPLHGSFLRECNREVGHLDRFSRTLASLTAAISVRPGAAGQPSIARRLESLQQVIGLRPSGPRTSGRAAFVPRDESQFAPERDQD